VVAETVSIATFFRPHFRAVAVLAGPLWVPNYQLLEIVSASQPFYHFSMIKASTGRLVEFTSFLVNVVLVIV
jgi:hypothetical protein